ncbi:sulfatase [Haladaptatus paucihalophilus DX253]|uniref:Sulfatase n=1 Tax=Haladaptatus paucihalophilus DX253 TaxID=797209 RepID=E7QZJ8_HALPU|nr:sulfatase-like hydrolase/transferase [Haladaptatus paucihalophilus]EFW90119.1 sulfatase [Haladaptatus paucihalophilus DX253]SHL06102.1 uncharacterized sulfatase [Haladaptatus paucihalophilus DX253]
MRSCIWITLESTRYDHTSFDSGRDTTPFLSKLSKSNDAVSFPDCHSHDIWTRSSTASILTGLSPSQHRTWHNNAALPETIRTIPEAFQDAGYKTVGVSPIAQFSPSTGLDKGFTKFHDISAGTITDTVPLRGLFRYLMKIRKESAGFTTDTGKHTTGPLNTEIVKKHIRKSESPLFIYTHLSDAHHPYYPPRDYRNFFNDDLPIPILDALELTMEVSENLHEYIATQQLTEDQLESLRVLYDLCIRFTDDLVEEIVTEARTHLDNPLVVVTADHGEQFGEEGLLAHMLIPNRAVTHIPMVVSGLDLPTTELVQPADVMAAITSELEIDHKVPAGKDPRDEHRKFAITEHSGERSCKKLDYISESSDIFDVSKFSRKDVVSIRTEKWRFQTDGNESVLRTSGENPAEDKEVATELASLINKWREENPQRNTSARADFSESQRKQLSDLGYL